MKKRIKFLKKRIATTLINGIREKQTINMQPNPPALFLKEQTNKLLQGI